MKKAKLFQTVFKKGENETILFPTINPWASLLNSLSKFSDDYMETRNQPDQQHREDCTQTHIS